MYTLTIIRGKYLGLDIFIPIIEDKNKNFDFTDLIIQEIDRDGGIMIVNRPGWQYLENQIELYDFLNAFFQQNEHRVIKKIDCLLKDSSDTYEVVTPYGNIQLPREKSFRLYALVREGENPFITPSDVELPILIVEK